MGEEATRNTKSLVASTDDAHRPKNNEGDTMPRKQYMGKLNIMKSIRITTVITN